MRELMAGRIIERLQPQIADAFLPDAIDNAFAVGGKFERPNSVLVDIVIGGFFVLDGIHIENQFVIEFANFKTDESLAIG